MLVQAAVEKRVGPVLSRCPVCRSGEHRRLFDVDGTAIVACDSCALVYAFMPDSARLTRYDEAYFNNRGQTKCGYQDYAALSRSHVATFGERILAAERRLGRVGAVLDVGCAYGDLLAVARKRGWRAVGLDISQHAAAFAWHQRSLPVAVGDLAGLPVADRSVDLVILYDIVEHLPDPVGALRQVRRVLKPDGLVHLTTPNVSSLSAQLLGRRWYHYKMAEHICFFSARTLAAALERAGLEVIQVQPSPNLMTLNDVAVRLRSHGPNGRSLALQLLKLLRAENTYVHLPVGEMEAWARKPGTRGNS